MLHYPHINPIAFSIGNFKIYWYGFAYFISFTSVFILAILRARKPNSPISPDNVIDACIFLIIGVLIGGRFGYTLFYQFSDFIHNPLVLFDFRQGGMSFHGGFLGTLIVPFIAYKIWYKDKFNFWDALDFFTPLMPIGLAMGRIGNFINGELWGRVTTSPLGMFFPKGGDLPRYPSQLFEFLLEGVVLFTILWLLSRKKRKRFCIIGNFLLWYGIFRVTCEFFRAPDNQLGFFLNSFTMGQILSLPMIIIGSGILVYIYFIQKDTP